MILGGNNPLFDKDEPKENDSQLISEFYDPNDEEFEVKESPQPFKTNEEYWSLEGMVNDSESEPIKSQTNLPQDDSILEQLEL